MTWFPVLTLVGRLIVETGSPDALCPDLASAEEAIHARLGALDAANWRVRYTIGHAPDATSGDFVRLELYDPENELKLSRDLPLAGESCATMAQVMALVVDRYFRAVVAEQKPEPRPDVRTPSGAPAPIDEAPAPREKPRSTLTGEAGMLAPPFSPTVGIAFSHRTRYRVSLGAALTWVVLPATEPLAGGAEAQSRSWLSRLTPAWHIALGTSELALGPTFALGFERGTTSGLPESDAEYRSVFAAGAAARLLVPLGSKVGFDLSAGAEAPFLPFGGTFVIDRVKALEPPPIRAFVAVGLGPAW